MEENEISREILDALTYLRLIKLHLGLLINFGKETLVGGYKRVVNGYV